MGDFTDNLKRYRQLSTRRAGIVLARLGVVVERTVKSQSLDALMVRRLAQVKRSGGEFFFLQIGANDGFSHDPINAFVSANHLAGIVVEPLPDVFERLCHTYRRHPQIRKLNMAVHEELAQVTLYRPDPARSSSKSGIASLSRERHEFTHSHTGIGADDIVSVEVPAISLPKLLDQENVDHLDLLQIDTEGHDMKILAGLDFARCRPSIIHFEHGVYSGVPARDELRETLLRLYDQGYSIAMERVDALAWLHADVSKKSRNTRT